MIHRLLAAVALATIFSLSPQQSLVASARTVATSASLPMFDTEAGCASALSARHRCMAQHEQRDLSREGMRWYGRTKHGAYVCRREADAAGDRDTRNGQ